MKVLFVCSGNAHRSPLAEALLKKMRPDLEVDSAGTSIAIPISSGVKRFLEKEHGQQFLKKLPEDVADKRLAEYDMIIAMEDRHKDYLLARCTECKDRIAVWRVDDPYLMPYEEAEKVYELIKERVEELAKQL